MSSYASGRVSLAICGGLALALLGIAPAKAECAQPHPMRVCTEYSNSELVFTGKVVSVKQWPQPADPNNVEGWFYKVEVGRTYRGSPGNTVELWWGNDPDGFPVKVGETYLLFARKGDDGRLAPNNCGNSGELAHSRDNSRDLDKLVGDMLAGAPATIGGRVVMTDAGSRALTDRYAFGVFVSAHNAEGEVFTRATSVDGWFYIPVPPGTYSLDGKSENEAMGRGDIWNIVPYPLSLSNPKKVTVGPSGCADVEFLAEPKMAETDAKR